MFKPMWYQNRWKALRKFATLIEFRWWQVVIPISLSVIISGLDALSLGLLAPLASGIATGDWQKVEQSSVIGRFLLGGLRNIFDYELDSVTVFAAISLLVLGANLVAVLISIVNAVYGRILQSQYQYRLNTAVYERYFEFGKAYFDKTSQGSIRKVLEYTERIVTLVRTSQNVLTNMIRLLAYMGVMIWLSPKLVAFFLVLFPVLSIVSRSIMRSVNVWWEKAKQINLKSGQESFNMLSALPLVWSYSKEREARQKYAKLMNEFRESQFKAQAWGDVALYLPRLLTVVALAVVVIYMVGWVIEDPAQDIATLAVFLIVASRTVPLLKVWNEFRVTVSEMLPPMREIIRLFSGKDKHEIKSGKIIFNGLKHSLEFKNLSFKYEDRPILRGIDFNVIKGQQVALVGASGSGKSTIVNLLLRFYDFMEGEILVDGQSIQKLDIESWRNKVAVIDQEPIVLHDTLRNNLAYGLNDVSDTELKGVIRKANLDKLVNRLPDGLATYLGDRGVRLSGGERQRIAIARALLKKADLLLLDEATSALDAVTEHEIQKSLESVIDEKTVIVVAHRLATIKGVDKIVYLEEGRVVEEGSWEELINKKGNFAKQWKMQVGEGDLSA